MKNYTLTDWIEVAKRVTTRTVANHLKAKNPKRVRFNGNKPAKALFVELVSSEKGYKIINQDTIKKCGYKYDKPFAVVSAGHNELWRHYCIIFVR